MRSLAIVAASVLGCASTEASAPLSAPAPAPMVAVSRVEPAAAPTGWPSASASGDASREQTKLRYEQLAAERDALERAVEGGSTPVARAGGCVTPDATRAAGEG
jgi:hypothetical protein